jgi:hypothetical protein
MVVEGLPVTVHDVIDQLAHIEGGVHTGDARTAKERALAEASRYFGIGGLPAGWRVLAAIARVVVRAVAPLRDAVVSGR